MELNKEEQKMEIKTDEKIDLTRVFLELDVETEYLRGLLENVLLMISRFMDVYEGFFGAVHEGRIFNEIAVISETGELYFDSYKMRRFDVEVAMAIVAHELAHYYLGHHKKSGWDANNEKEADQLAEKWGFNIEKLRRCL